MCADSPGSAGAGTASAGKSREHACPVCGAKRCFLRYRSRDRLLETTDRIFNLHACPDCACLFLDPVPGENDAEGLFPPGYWWTPAGGGVLRQAEGIYRRLVLRDHVSFVSRAGRLPAARGRRLLDVGCAGGTFLDLMRDRGFEVLGVDTSAEAAAIAFTAHGIDVKVGKLEECDFGQARFDVITMFHVVEHLADAGKTLAAAAALLAPDGRLVVQVPNAGSLQRRVLGPRWYGLDVPRHAINHSEQSLRRLLETGGFEVVRASHRSLRDNAPALVSSVFPALDPVRRAVVARRRGQPEALLVSWLKHMAYLFLVFSVTPWTFFEAVFGFGATVMVEARRRSD